MQLHGLQTFIFFSFNRDFFQMKELNLSKTLFKFLISKKDSVLLKESRIFFIIIICNETVVFVRYFLHY